MAKNTRPATKKKKERSIQKKITQKSKQANNQRKLVQWLKRPVAPPKTKTQNEKSKIKQEVNKTKTKIRILEKKENKATKLIGSRNITYISHAIFTLYLASQFT